MNQQISFTLPARSRFGLRRHDIGRSELEPAPRTRPAAEVQIGIPLVCRLAAYSADNPVLREIGRYTVAEVLADFEDARS